MIYGGTPGGIAAAIGAAREGATVILIEPTQRIGGLVTCGLSHTDFHSLESLSGAFLEFSRRVESHYAKQYGRDSLQVKDSWHGTFAEPKVNLAVFEAMLAEYPSITVIRECVLTRPDMENAQRIQTLTLRDAGKASSSVAGRVFVDATYEGDLMAAAGVPWRVGREGKSEFNESLAPDQPDEQLQAYNFRFIMTRDPANRISPTAPSGYRREDFVDILPVLESDTIKKVFDYPRGCLFKAQTPPLPNKKYDINDVSQGLVRLSLPGKNAGWPAGDDKTRAAIFAEHVRDQAGLLYFLQNDTAVPERYRNEAREWGWCKDEFTETGGLPPQLYVREARRMRGMHVFRQQDSEHAPGDARAVLHKDAIAMGDYGNNCHGTAHEGPRFGGKHTGEFYNPVPPYQIPYGVIVPSEMTNLLVPVAASSTHVGFCALRLEPIWMSLGQAAGHAAGIAAKSKEPVQKISVHALQRSLRMQGSATIYVSDVLPGHPQFEAVQWWGTAGGLHGLASTPSTPREIRGKNLHGQYSEANPRHAAELDQVLDAELGRRWRELAISLKAPTDRLPPADGKTTRGQFIEAAFKAANDE
ncbi:xanthan lyase [Planctomyces sp. SCGC AG-212-M04]|nr:xanthan lyase [Planctomyces sp. SCGC AG-212-M04]